MNKDRNNYLMLLADNALRSTKALFKNNDLEIDKSYNGQIASFGVAIAMSGIRPALAIYYHDQQTHDWLDSQSKVCRRNILTVIAEMIKNDSKNVLLEAEPNDFSNAKSLFSYALTIKTADGLNKLTREIEDCAIALKQVVRTYKLV